MQMSAASDAIANCPGIPLTSRLLPPARCLLPLPAVRLVQALPN
jgi:hypothetical protein